MGPAILACTGSSGYPIVIAHAGLSLSRSDSCRVKLSGFYGTTLIWIMERCASAVGGFARSTRMVVVAPAAANPATVPGVIASAHPMATTVAKEARSLSGGDVLAAILPLAEAASCAATSTPSLSVKYLRAILADGEDNRG